jgi:acetyl/propionyl-CoA carboxylase alpha subunit
MTLIRTLLIANRGEIACRILSTCRLLGIRGVVVYSQADANSLAVRLADQAILVGPAEAARSYLNIEAVLEAAARSGADAVHPGYGFLAENAEFARRVSEAGLIFVGPPAGVIEQMGCKVAARKVCQQAGVPVVPGSLALDDSGLLDWASTCGYPVMLKASAGGGGKGMRRLEGADALRAAIPSARREAEKAFGRGDLYLEKALERARHLEVQIASDSFGNHIHLGVRECSLQRRHQKVVEECPPANLCPRLQQSLTSAALRLVEQVRYSGLGTVEFLVDGDQHYFLEMNTRLQVEHPVTEAVTGLDLVQLQLSIAEGHPLPLGQDEVVFRGHAIEARLACEDPGNGFLPATGPVLEWAPALSAAGARVDCGIETGAEVTPHYDSMVAKLVAWGGDRPSALRRLRYALSGTVLLGLRHNLDFLVDLLDHPDVVTGQFHTEWIEAWRPPPRSVSLRQLLAVCAARHGLQASRGAQLSRNPQTTSGVLGAMPTCWEFEDQPAVSVQGCRYQVEDRVFEVLLEAGVLTVDGHRTAVSVAHRGDRWWVHTPEGTACLTALPRHPLPRARIAGGSLKAPMPGSIVEVLVQVGQRVEAGCPLLKLEAMKMEHQICAPWSGVVTSVPFAAGERVEVGVELLGLAEEA